MGGCGWRHEQCPARPALAGARVRLPLAIAAAMLLAVVAAAAVLALYLQRPVAAAESRSSFRYSQQRRRFGRPMSATFDGPRLRVLPMDAGSRLRKKRGHGPVLSPRRTVGAVAPTRLPGPDDATQPFWLPTSRSIGVVAGGKLPKVGASGGPPQDIAPAPTSSGADSKHNGTIIFGTKQRLFKVSRAGGHTGGARRSWSRPSRVTTRRTSSLMAAALSSSSGPAQAGVESSLPGRLTIRPAPAIMPTDSKAMYAKPRVPRVPAVRTPSLRIEF